MKVKQVLILLLLYSISLGTTALPGAFNASYTVSKSGLTLGEMRVSLLYKDQAYYYYKNTKATGLASWLSGDRMIENAEGKVKGNYLQASSYLFHHTSKRKDRKDQFKFVTPRLAEGEYKGETYSVQVPNGTLDRATLEIALARDLTAEKKSLIYSIIERGKQKKYLFNRLGTEKITVGDKDYLAEKLMVARKDRKRSTTFWLAKELDYMPVKINHVEKGDAIVTQLKWFDKSIGK